MYERVRRRIENLKIKSYRACRKRAALLIKKDIGGGGGGGGGIDKADIKKVDDARKEAILGGYRKGRIARDDNSWKKLVLPTKIAELEKVGKDLHYPTINSTSLSQVLRSVFEVAEEQCNVLSTNATLEEFMKKAADEADALTL